MGTKIKMKENPPEVEVLHLDDPADRRRKSRRMADSTFVVGSVSGRLVDVSEWGLGLEAQQPLPVLKEGTFTLGISKARPQFQGEIRWCRLIGTAESANGEQSPIYRAGIALSRR